MPLSSSPPSQADAQEPPPSPSHKATDDLLAAVTTPSPSFKSILVQSLIHRALGNSELAPVVAELAKVVLASSPTPPKSADRNLSPDAHAIVRKETEKPLRRDSVDEDVQEMLLDALKAAAKAATSNGGLVDRGGLYKLVAALVDLGILDRRSVRNLLHEVEGDGERGPGDNGYH